MQKEKGWYRESARHSLAKRTGYAGGSKKGLTTPKVKGNKNKQLLNKGNPKGLWNNKTGWKEKREDPFKEYNKGKVSFEEMKKDDSVYNYSEADEVADAKKREEKFKKEQYKIDEKQASDNFFNSASLDYKLKLLKKGDDVKEGRVWFKVIAVGENTIKVREYYHEKRIWYLQKKDITDAKRNKEFSILNTFL